MLIEKIIIARAIAIKVFFNEIILKRNEFLKISFKDNFTVVNKGKLYINEKANSKLIKIQINKGTYKRLLLDDALEQKIKEIVINENNNRKIILRN